MKDLNCIFCKIIAGDIPCKKVYEDKDIIIIEDIEPKAPHHYLMILKEHYNLISDLDAEMLQRWVKALQRATKMTKELHLEGGFRIVINQGENAGEIRHLHAHILSGKKMGWTPA